MEDYRSLSHTRWQCKYHVIFIPKYRRKALYGAIRKEIGKVFHRLAQPKECWIEEGYVMPDPVHMLLNVPPKLAVSSVEGYIKGKSAIHIARYVLKGERNYAGQSLWARGYFVDTVGRDTEVIRRYIAEQEEEDRRVDQLELGFESQKVMKSKKSVKQD
jgi:putative transposase